MKQYFLATLMLLTASFSSVPASAQKHRQTTPAQQATVIDTTSAGIDAYSDTTSLQSSVQPDSASSHHVVTRYHWDFDDIDNPVELLNALSHIGTAGVIIAIVGIIFALLLCLAPFILVAFILYMAIRRHNDKVRLAEKAMASGQPIPEAATPKPTEEDEALWRKGIKNAAVGVGLALMFWIMGAESLAGIGLLVLCCGVGQMIMARTSASKKSNNPEF